MNAPQHAAAAEDRLRAPADAPRSLQSGAGRQYWDEVLRLLVQIRADCDAAAERLGYASRQDDGLAAVEYIAIKVLEAVRGERQQRIASAKKPSAKKPSAEKQAAPRPPDVLQQSATEARYKPDKRAQPAPPAAHSERSKLIDELKQMLRDGKTKAGLVIDPPLAHEIAKHITILNEEVAQPDTIQSIKRIRDSVARFFGKASGSEKTATKPAAMAASEKSKRARTDPSRANKTVTKRSVAKGSRGAKQRSR